MDISKKNLNKIRKKAGRCLELVKIDTGCDIETSPSRFVLLGNAGLTTGWDDLTLAELFLSSGIAGLECISVIPGKQFSFATFSSTEEAKNAIDVLNGHMIKNNKPLYMTSINKIPDGIRCNVEYKNPPGLVLLDDFVTETQEIDLMSLIDWQDCPSTSSVGSSLKHRQVRHFGYEFKYGSNDVDKTCPLETEIPSLLSDISQKIKDLGLMEEVPDQITVNKYVPGQGIPSHVDTHSSFTGEILSLSVGSDIVMDFRQQEIMQHYAVLLPRRSLCIMTGPSRYEWSHGICPRMTDVIPTQGSNNLRLSSRQERISFTFRKLRQGECNCSYSAACDSQKDTSCRTKVRPTCSDDDGQGDCKDINKISPEMLEKLHVLNVYDEIADHFSMTRHKPWPRVLEFVMNLSPGSTLLDVGCGNGKYLGHNKQINSLGCDTSMKLLEICRERGFNVVPGNCLQLPIKDLSSDAAICIAVIHHLATEERRLAAIKELIRVLRIGGVALIYVWAMEQRRGKNKSSYLKQNKANRKNDNIDTSNTSELTVSGKKEMEDSKLNSEMFQVHKNRTEFIEQDMFVPWKIKPQGMKPDKKSTQESEDIDTFTLKYNNEENARSKNTHTPIYHRFYHVFKEGELQDLCNMIPNIKVISSYYDEGNWCISFEKIK